MYYITRTSIAHLFQVSEETKKHIHQYALENVFGYSEDDEPEEIRKQREYYEEGWIQGLEFALEYELGEWE